jgi:hypothetical protein
MQAESLVEWQYPPDKGDWFLLQEQVKEFLQARNFHRRYSERYVLALYTMMFINILTHAPWTSLHETYFLLLAI